jgi:hypothetical protein
MVFQSKKWMTTEIHLDQRPFDRVCPMTPIILEWKLEVGQFTLVSMSRRRTFQISNTVRYSKNIRGMDSIYFLQNTHLDGYSIPLWIKFSIVRIFPCSNVQQKKLFSIGGGGASRCQIPFHIEFFGGRYECDNRISYPLRTK